MEKTHFNLYWGDIHRQTSWTCGEGTPDDHFRIAREYLGLDFAAVTDNARLAEDPTERLFPGAELLKHRHFLNGLKAHSISEAQWRLLQESVKRNSRDGWFVALLGYEWCSARYGDHNVYYDTDNGPLYVPEKLESLYAGSPDAIGLRRLIIPHHPGYSRGRRGVDWNHHDPRQERLVEVYSTQHGCSESDASGVHSLYSKSMGSMGKGTSVQRALERGYKLGFTGGSDSHFLLQKPGLTGVFASDLSRGSLFEGLWNRRTIASTGPKFGAWFSVDGYGLGSMVALDYLPCIEIQPFSQSWVKMELVRNGDVIRSWQNHGNPVRLIYSEVNEGLAPDNYYYVRVLLAEDDMVWLSPIWVSYLPDTPFAQNILYWLPEIDVHFWGRRLDDATVVLKLHNLSRAEGPITDITFEVIDAAGTPITAEELGPGSSLAPGESAEVRLEVPAPAKRCLEQAGPYSYRVRYRDHWDNVRIVHRKRILTSGESTVFPLESSWNLETARKR